MSRPNAYWRSQLKCQKLRVGSCMEEVLKWFNYPHTRAHPRCKVSCQVVPTWLAVSPCFIEASPAVEKAELCYKADWLVASFPQHSVITCSMWILCCRRRTLRMRPQKCVWTFDAWCPGIHSTSEQSQLDELSGSTFGFTLQEFHMVASYTEDLKITQNYENWRRDTCAGMGTCPRQYGSRHSHKWSSLLYGHLSWIVY